MFQLLPDAGVVRKCKMLTHDVCAPLLNRRTPWPRKRSKAFETKLNFAEFVHILTENGVTPPAAGKMLTSKFMLRIFSSASFILASSNCKNQVYRLAVNEGFSNHFRLTLKTEFID